MKRGLRYILQNLQFFLQALPIRLRYILFNRFIIDLIAFLPKPPKLIYNNIHPFQTPKVLVLHIPI